MIPLMIAALLLPGAVAYWLGRKAGRSWPGVILACGAMGWGGWLVYRSLGAAAGDAAAVNQILTAFALAAPAALSALVGMGFERMRRARAA